MRNLRQWRAEAADEVRRLLGVEVDWSDEEVSEAAAAAFRACEDPRRWAVAAAAWGGGLFSEAVLRRELDERRRAGDDLVRRLRAEEDAFDRLPEVPIDGPTDLAGRAQQDDWWEEGPDGP